MGYSLIADRVKALVISSNWDVRSDLTEYLAELGVPSLMASGFEGIPYAYLEDYQPDYVFVSIDDFGGPTLLYDQLHLLRQKLCDSSIILVSSEFEVDEYGTHRLPLADVSLRYPFAKSSLFLALKQAPINLGVWHSRHGHKQVPGGVGALRI
ncbi:hypothetical protein DZK27_14895 [Rhodobacteraceae bacterium 63075]|nr:hypothetical protein DZK27_14895 [Rhodobacteraceae bacterium 63075]